jgi:hypothetical protein
VNHFAFTTTAATPGPEDSDPNACSQNPTVVSESTASPQYNGTLPLPSSSSCGDPLSAAAFDVSYVRGVVLAASHSDPSQEDSAPQCDLSVPASPEKLNFANSAPFREIVDFPVCACSGDVNGERIRPISPKLADFDFLAPASQDLQFQLQDFLPLSD